MSGPAANVRERCDVGGEPCVPGCSPGYEEALVVVTMVGRRVPDVNVSALPRRGPGISTFDDDVVTDETNL